MLEIFVLFYTLWKKYYLPSYTRIQVFVIKIEKKFCLQVVVWIEIKFSLLFGISEKLIESSMVELLSLNNLAVVLMSLLILLINIFWEVCKNNTPNISLEHNPINQQNWTHNKSCDSSWLYFVLYVDSNTVYANNYL